MTNVEARHRGRSAAQLLLLLLFLVSLTLALAADISPAGAVREIAKTDAETHALLIGLRADRVPHEDAPDRAALAPAGDIRQMHRLFRQRGVYRDPLLDAPVALEHVYRLELAPGVSLQETMARLQQRPDVAFVEPDHLAEQVATPDDPLFDQQWGLTQINAPAAWDVQTGGALVALVDAGIDVDHPDLSAQLWTNPGEIPGNGTDDDSNGYVDDVHGWNFYGDDGDLSDSTGHGTQVAGIVGATGNNATGVAGVCWDCRLMVLKVIQPGGTANYSDIAEAIDYAAEKGADVVNLSLGGYSDSVTLRAAVTGAADGAVLVGGAGNDGDDQPFYPAAYEGVLAVAGTDDADVRVGSSNYGAWVDLSAPGSDVMSTFDGANYGQTAGTSLAAPFASGAAALLQGAHDWSPALVRAHLHQTATPIDGANPGYDGLLGSGRLDAGTALTTMPAPDLVAESITVDGQDGGRPEPGTTVDLHITLRNDWAPVGPLQGTLSSSDPYVTVEESSTTFDGLDTYATGQSATPLRITVANDAPYGHALALQLALSDNDGAVDAVALEIPVAGQTVEVSGLINSNTTWSGDRLYHLTGNTVIAASAILTVEAGTRVLVEPDTLLRVQGELLAAGTAEAPVVFTSAANSPAPEDWAGLEILLDGRIELVHCEVSYANTGILFNGTLENPNHIIDNCTIHHNRTGVLADVGGITISHSRLLHNEDHGAYLGISDTIVRDSEIAFNGGGIAGASHLIRNSIHHNQGPFDNSTGIGAGIFLSPQVYSNTIILNNVGLVTNVDRPADIFDNNIDQNLSYNAYNNAGWNASNVTLSNNWWGSTELAAINETIYDFGEDSDRGIVDVQPILTGPSPAAPAYFYDVEIAPDTTVGLQEATLDMSFSAPMDQSQAPNVTLYLDRQIDLTGVFGAWDSQVTDVAVTDDGSIWLAVNMQGIVQYDGNDFTLYLEDNANQSHLAVDINGDLWVVRSTGVWRFDGSDWHNYSDGPHFLPGASKVAADPGGGVWLLYCYSVTYFDGITRSDYEFGDPGDITPSCGQFMDVSSDGTLWVATSAEIHAFDGSWSTYRPLGEGETSEEIFGIAADNTETWIVTQNTVRHFDGQQWIVHTPGFNAGYSTYNWVIEVTANGAVWIASGDHWASYDGSTWTTRALRADFNAFILHIGETTDGGLWFGTDSGAVQLYETPVQGGQWLNENAFQATHQVTSLMPRGPYDVDISGAFDAHGNETPPVSRPAFTVDYAGEVADVTAPSPPLLSVNGVDGDASAVTAQWQASDPDSAIVAYRYAIGSSAGGRQIIDWTNTADTEIRRSGLGLVEGQTYWFTVQAQNSGGLWSESTTRSFVAGRPTFSTFLPAVTRK